MISSSERTVMRIDALVEFGKRHPSTRYLCLAGVSIICGAEFIRRKAVELAERIKASVTAPFRPLFSRIAAFALSGAFAFMVLPLGAEVSADEYTEPASAVEEENLLPKPAALADNAPVSAPQVKAEESKPSKRRKVAATAEDIAERVTKSGLAENNDDYKITLNIRTLKEDITARFSSKPYMKEQIKESFAGYNIPTNDLYISPVDITIFTTEDRYRLNLKEGYSADITLPIPQEMNGHLDDLKVVRLEDDGMMTIIDGSIGDGENGKTISFNTEHFSIFALVSYNDGITAENISSGAGISASGMTVDTAISFSSSVFEEDKRRFGRTRKRKVYRIKRIAKEQDLLLI